jgi:Putative sensor
MPSTKGITPPVHSPADRAPEPRDREVHRTEVVGGVPGRETRQGRIRAWTTSSLRDLGYDGAVFLWSIVAFTILVAGISVTASLLVVVIGVFVWVGFAYIVRWTTCIDRRLAGWQRKERVRAVYRRPAARGFLPRLKTVSSDPQTWRDLAWLGLTSIAGFALGLAAITAAGIVLAYVSMPIWYWAISDPTPNTESPTSACSPWTAWARPSPRARSGSRSPRLRCCSRAAARPRTPGSPCAS